MRKYILMLLGLALVVSSPGFERAYVKRAMLTKEQEQVVLALAQQCGIEQVVKISTHNMYPSSFRNVRVHGQEVLNGREVSFQVLSVSHGAWLHPGAKPGKDDLQLGAFWAGKPYTRKQTILKVGKQAYRTGSIQGITVEECERILGLLLAGEYHHGPSVKGKTLNQVDWTRPSRFTRRGESISVGFLHKAEGSGFFDLQITLHAKRLTIDQVFQAIP